MNYFIDTEFLEGTQDKRVPFFNIKYGKTKNTIDLISVGIVAEDGREYYAISKDFNLKEAWNRFQYKIIEHKNLPNEIIKEYWIRENVLKPIFDEHYIDVFGTNMPTFNFKSFKYLINTIGKTNQEIADKIKKFCTNNRKFKDTIPVNIRDTNIKPINFYGYYADYDWVVFCWLFGKMIDLPKGFPMYCIDLKQILDDKANALPNTYITNTITEKTFSYSTLKSKLKYIKKHSHYPKQTNEHNALADARWNQDLYNFLNNYNVTR